MYKENETEEFVLLLLECATALTECGCPTTRTEVLLTQLGKSLGYTVEASALPTSVSLSIRRGSERTLEMTRVRQWELDLNRLNLISELVDKIKSRGLTVTEARERLNTVVRSSPPYSAVLTGLAGGISSMSVMYFNDGSPLEISLSWCIGAIVSMLNRHVFVGDVSRYLGDFLLSCITTFIALSVGLIFESIRVPMLIGSGMFVLVPGLVLVNAVHEIAQKNLVAGSARFFEAIVIALSLAFGVVSVSEAYNLLFS